MSLIINKKIPMLRKGYPTVSDKYNVCGGILTGDNAVKFGEVVLVSGQTADGNFYVKPTTTFTLAAFAGLVLATNVKLAQDWPGTTVQVNPGEAFNLALPGTYMTVELAANIDGTSIANIVANKQVAIFLSGDQLAQITYTGATSTDGSPVTATDLPGYTFTGVWEKQGSKYLAEIYIK